jgi:hypothetical protein
MEYLHAMDLAVGTPVSGEVPVPAFPGSIPLVESRESPWVAVFFDDLEIARPTTRNTWRRRRRESVRREAGEPP